MNNNISIDKISARDGLMIMKVVYYSLLSAYNLRLIESKNEESYNSLYEFAKGFSKFSKEEQYFYLSAGFIFSYEDMAVLDLLLKYIPENKEGIKKLGAKVITEKTTLNVKDLSNLFDILWSMHLSLIDFDNFFFHSKE